MKMLAQKEERAGAQPTMTVPKTSMYLGVIKGC